MNELGPDSGGEASVVLVDDNPFDNEYTTIVLRKAGYTGQVKTFVCGQDLLAAVDGGTFLGHLVLLDINMPGMDGFEMASELSARAGEGYCPVIMLLTSSPDPREHERAAMVAILRGVLVKPLSVRRIGGILDSVFGPSATGGRTRGDPSRSDRASGS